MPENVAGLRKARLVNCLHVLIGKVEQNGLPFELPPDVSRVCSNNWPLW